MTKNLVLYSLVGFFIFLRVNAEAACVGTQMPWAANDVHSETPSTHKEISVNVTDIYKTCELAMTPFMTMFESNKERVKTNSSDAWENSFEWVEVQDLKSIGVPSNLKKGGTAWLVTPEYSGPLKCTKILLGKSPAFNEVKFELDTLKAIPPIKTYSYGLIFDEPLPSQAWSKVDLSEHELDNLKLLAKRQFPKGEKWEFSQWKYAIRTNKGNFTVCSFNNVSTANGDFNGDYQSLVMQEIDGKDWAVISQVSENLDDALTVDIDGDGVPEIGSPYAYQSFMLRSIYPKVIDLRSGTYE